IPYRYCLSFLGCAPSEDWPFRLIFEMLAVIFRITIGQLASKAYIRSCAWMGAPGQISIGSLVPGAAYVEAKSAHRTGDVARHLAPSVPGNLGNLSVNQLWQFQNQSAIFHVNVVNTTEPHHPTGEIPLQLTLDTQRKGITNGNFRWRGTMLHYDFGGRTNGGVYYHCPTPDGAKLLLFLKGTNPECPLHKVVSSSHFMVPVRTTSS
ncbi:hypothetical protein MPER_09941, partial [Moniliophthora perniciosa FA553]